MRMSDTNQIYGIRGLRDSRESNKSAIGIPTIKAVDVYNVRSQSKISSTKKVTDYDKL